MSEEELIETLKEFEKSRVEQLKEPSRNLFYAIMKIADERDKYKIVLDKIKEILKDYGDKEDILEMATYFILGESLIHILELLEEIE